MQTHRVLRVVYRTARRQSDWERTQLALVRDRGSSLLQKVVSRWEPIFRRATAGLRSSREDAGVLNAFCNGIGLVKSDKPSGAWSLVTANSDLPEPSIAWIGGSVNCKYPAIRSPNAPLSIIGPHPSASLSFPNKVYLFAKGQHRPATCSRVPADA